MFQVSSYAKHNLKDYKMMHKQFKSLIEDENDEIALLSNATALLNQFLHKINWVGFYIWKKDELVLGPFQGLPACNRIPYGKGVCGTAVKEQKTQRVADVEKFPGHIACDAASRSEIVIPLIINNRVYGVLDVDSPITGRFSEVDEQGLESFVNILQQHLLGILHK